MTGRAEDNRVVVLRPERDTGEFNAVDTIEGAGWSARFGWWVLVLGFGGFLAWAAWAPLDNGVAMPVSYTHLDVYKRQVLNPRVQLQVCKTQKQTLVCI